MAKVVMAKKDVDVGKIFAEITARKYVTWEPGGTIFLGVFMKTERSIAKKVMAENAQHWW